MGISGSNGRRSPDARHTSAHNGRTSAMKQRRTTHLKFNFASDLVTGHDVQKQIMDAVESFGFHCDSVFAIKLALEEALINAIRHGNKLDPQKMVRVEARISPKRAEITIEDEGPGFQRCDVP